MEDMRKAVEDILEYILVEGLHTDYSPGTFYKLVTCSNGSIVLTEGFETGLVGIVNRERATTFPDCNPNLIKLVNAFNVILYGKRWTQ
jgi:hypothetical protein